MTTGSRLPKLRPEIVWHRDGDAPGCLFSPRTGDLYLLNRTAAAILERLEAASSDEEIAAALADRFLVSAKTAGRDVRTFLGLLREHELAS